jgi:Fe-S oxidoreductase
LVLTEGKLDADAQRAITNIERQGNPWGINRKERKNWIDGRDDIKVPTAKELKKSGDEFEYLFFVGSMGSYDNRSQKVAQSFAYVLNLAGVKFAILGNEEKNSGDTPRRIGNEFLFQELANANIEAFKKYDVKKIVTMDPHAFNTLKNEYPEFGLEAEVYHHTQLLSHLIKEGKLTPKNPVNEVISFHDSCYLGRYNEVYDAPREILKAIPGVKLVEVERHHENAMCCGAGGGRMWMEENTGTRINVARTEQLLEKNPTVIGSGCPYCLTMISDGTKSKEVDDKVQTLDIVEVLEKSL